MVIERSTLLIGGAGLLGVALAVAVPIVSYARMRQAEHAAADVLRAVAVAQTAFRAGAGRGAYATDLAALTTPCPGEPVSARELSDRILAASSREGARDVSRYVFSLGAAQGAQTMGTDCHGRATASEYYAAATPRSNGVDGRQAFAMRSDGRIFVFFDGVAPREADMDPGGLATPLDSLSTFKIP